MATSTILHNQADRMYFFLLPGNSHITIKFASSSASKGFILAGGYTSNNIPFISMFRFTSGGGLSHYESPQGTTAVSITGATNTLIITSTASLELPVVVFMSADPTAVTTAANE